MSCTRSRIRLWHLLAQNSINSSNSQVPPQLIQASCKSRDSSPSHQFGSPKLDTCKMQINFEKTTCSAKNWSDFPSEIHSLFPMSGGILTQPRAGPSSPRGPCDSQQGHPDLETATPHSEQLQGLRVHF